MAEKITNTKPKTLSFEEFLREKGFITKENLTKAQTESVTSHRNLYDFLVSEHFISEEDLTRARGLFFNLPYVDLKTKNIAKQVLQAVSKEAISNYKFVPFEMDNGVLKVALTDPTNLSALEALEFLGQKNKVKMELYITSFNSFQTVFRKSGNLTTEVSQALQEVATKEK